MLSLAKATIIWTTTLTIACIIDFNNRMEGYKKKK